MANRERRDMIQWGSGDGQAASERGSIRPFYGTFQSFLTPPQLQGDIC